MKKYKNIKLLIVFLIKLNMINSALKLIRFYALIKYNLNDVFFDDEIEDDLMKIANQYKSKLNKTKTNKDYIIFYDQVSNTNRCLSKIYLEGLINISEKKLVYVCYKCPENRGLIDLCKENNIEFYELNKRYELKSLDMLIHIFNQFPSSIIISQNHVDDFIGVLL